MMSETKESFIKTYRKDMIVSVFIAGPFFLLFQPIICYFQNWTFFKILMLYLLIFPFVFWGFYVKPILIIGKLFQRMIEFAKVNGDTIEIISFKWYLHKQCTIRINKSDVRYIKNTDDFKIECFEVTLIDRKKIYLFPDFLENQHEIMDWFGIAN